MRSSVKTHVGILLRKDWYTLKRSWSYLLSFVLLPLGMMTFFSFIHDKLQGRFMLEQHNFEHSVWTKKANFHHVFMGSDMKNNPPSWEAGIYNMSALWGCGVSSKRQVGMVSSYEFN